MARRRVLEEEEEDDDEDTPGLLHRLKKPRRGEALDADYDEMEIEPEELRAGSTTEARRSTSAGDVVMTEVPGEGSDDEDVESSDEEEEGVERQESARGTVLCADNEYDGADQEPTTELIDRMRTARAANGNTDRSYKPYCNEFKATCKAQGWSCAVTGKKLAFQVRIWSTRSKNTTARRQGEPAKHLHPATLNLATAAVIDLWHSQEGRVMTDEQGRQFTRSAEHPRTTAVQLLIKEYEARWAQLCEAERRDPTLGTVAENGGTTSLSIGRMSARLFSKDSFCADRTRCDAVLGAVCIGRADEKRKLNLSGTVAVGLDDIGPEPCIAMIGLMKQRKSSKGHCATSYLVALRNSNLWECPFNAFACFMLRRFEIAGEPYPDFEKGRGWYDVKLLVNSQKNADKTQPLARSTESEHIAEMLKNDGVKAAHISHIFRSQGLAKLEVKAAGHLQEGQAERLGGWNMNVMRSIYAKHVPFQAALVMAGFPSVDYNDKFAFPRALSDKSRVVYFAKMIGFYEHCDRWIAFARENPDARLEDKHPICGSSVGFAQLVKASIEALVEDAPFMMKEVPNHRIWFMRPFCLNEYREFAEDRRNAVASASEPAIDVSSIQNAAIARALTDVRASVTNLHSQLQSMASNRWMRCGTQQVYELVHPCVPAPSGAPPPAVASSVPLPAERPAVNRAAIQVFEDAPSASSSILPAVQRAVPTAPSHTAILRAIENVPDGPVYKLYREGIFSVVDVWNELVRGLRGTPSIRAIVQQHGPQWASKGRQKKAAHAESSFMSDKRKPIWDEVLRLAAAGRADANEFTKPFVPTPDDDLCDRKAVELQARYDAGEWFTGTGSMTLDKFITVLKAERRERWRQGAI
mmetsp:Transcript_8938/g.28372  ORF Transcript_8938/g.28372 Transcript_8938/m.28372 type:complete len:866 (+) Transcript_8938:149-2746(+)